MAVPLAAPRFDEERLTGECCETWDPFFFGWDEQFLPSTIFFWIFVDGFPKKKQEKPYDGEAIPCNKGEKFLFFANLDSASYRII